jgi:anhydro-N-acetylmuramic acid kinase
MSPKARKPESPKVRLVIGCMTGTSLDGLDAVLAEISGKGLNIRVTVHDRRTASLGRLAAPLRAVAEQQPVTAGDLAKLSRDFSLLHTRVLKRFGVTPDLVVVHGQTVFHAPPVSWQMLTPAVIAEGLGCAVVSDLRAADLAAGGEGAPITPLADLVLYGHARERRTVINLGGFCNLTRLPVGRDPKGIRGGDVCACNQVLDAVARTALNRAYDPEGKHAQRGTSDYAAERDLVNRLERQRRAGRSLGTGDELATWLKSHHLQPNDLARTACAAIATVIASAAAPADRLVLAGGGTRNRALVAEISARSAAPVVLSDELGIPAGDREALGMAVLGALCQDGIPITLSAVTNVAKAPLSGTWCFIPKNGF